VRPGEVTPWGLAKGVTSEWPAVVRERPAARWGFDNTGVRPKMGWVESLAVSSTILEWLVDRWARALNFGTFLEVI
jgi:hypothetical protein